MKPPAPDLRSPWERVQAHWEAIGAHLEGLEGEGLANAQMVVLACLEGCLYDLRTGQSSKTLTSVRQVARARHQYASLGFGGDVLDVMVLADRMNSVSMTVGAQNQVIRELGETLAGAVRGLGERLEPAVRRIPAPRPEEGSG